MRRRGDRQSHTGLHEKCDQNIRGKAVTGFKEENPHWDDEEGGQQRNRFYV